MNEVRFGPMGFAYVDVAIKPMSSTTMEFLPYKVDSGANCTTINCTRLYKLGYSADWIKSGKLLVGNARPTVASGLSVDDCYEVILPEICIGDWVGYNWPFITSLSVPFKLLLGTDSMQYFNWDFNYQKGICKFDLIPDMRKLLFDSKEQSIHAVDGTK